MANNPRSDTAPAIPAPEPAPPLAVSASSIQGLGVFTTQPYAAADTVLTVDDSHAVLPGSPVTPEQERFCDFLDHGRIVILQTPERHINHSCDPNVAVRSVAGIRQVYAIRPIAAGEELTFDYSINGFGDTVWTCHCRAARCRQIIHSDFFHLPLALQYEYLPLLDTWYRQQHADQVRRLETPQATPSLISKDVHASHSR